MMSNTTKIKNLAELYIEIASVKAEYQLKEIQLKDDAKAYIKQYSPINLIKNLFKSDGLLKFDEQTHVSGSIMSMILPLVLNKTIFRGSGLITKAIAALVSGKIGKSLDVESLTGMFNKVKSVFASKSDKKVAKFADYGIPPDSETF